MMRSFKPLKSSIISEVRYNDDAQRLYVQFNDGNVYGYSGVTLSRYVHFRDAVSAGSYFANRIKNNFIGARLPYGFPQNTATAS